MEFAPKQEIEKIKEAWGAKCVQDEELRRSLSKRDGFNDGMESALLEKMYGQQGSEVI